MNSNSSWTRDQLLIAYKLYCQMSFGKMHSRNPEIIKYAKLLKRTPSALAMKLTNIASLDPAITSTGRSGLTGASKVDKAMWVEMKNDWNLFVIASTDAEQRLGLPTDKNNSIECSPIQLGILDEIDYSGKSKVGNVNVRIGQNFFRKSVLSAYNFQCSISGLSIPQLLVASHIVPWSTDDKNRLNPRNGICLSAIHDKAFDLGIITITEKMTVKVANDYLMDTFLSDRFFISSIIKFEGQCIKIPEKFIPEKEFLHYHNFQIFKGKL